VSYFKVKTVVFMRSSTVGVYNITVYNDLLANHTIRISEAKCKDLCAFLESATNPNTTYSLKGANVEYVFNSITTTLNAISGLPFRS